MKPVVVVKILQEALALHRKMKKKKQQQKKKKKKKIKF